MASDSGFGGIHSVSVDAESLDHVGADVFTKAHPNVPWQRQFEHAQEMGFHEATPKG